MAGRPRKDVTPAQRAEVMRLAKRRKGWRTIVRLTGLAQAPVRRVLREEGLRKWKRHHIRDDLTLRQVSELTGRSEPALLAAHRRGELPLFQSEGAWRCQPVELQRWCMSDPSRIDVTRWEDALSMLALLTGHWGGDVVRTAVNPETERKAEKKARAKERANGSSGEGVGQGASGTPGSS